MFDHGQLKHRCHFESLSEQTDGAGGVVVQWNAQFARWGALAFPKLAMQLDQVQDGAISTPNRGTLTILEDPDTRNIQQEWRVKIHEDQYRSDYWNIGEIRRVSNGYIRMSVERGVPV